MAFAYDVGGLLSDGTTVVASRQVGIGVTDGFFLEHTDGLDNFILRSVSWGLGTLDDNPTPTPTATIVVACRQALVALLEPRPGLADVQISYGWPGTDKVEGERIYTARASGEHEDAALKAGRRFRREKARFDVVIEAAAVNGTPEDAESRTLELGTEVEECIADEKYLADVTGLIMARVSGFTLDSGSNEYGSIAQLIYTVRYEARLT